MVDALTSAMIGAGAAIIGGLCNGAYQHVGDWWTRPLLGIDYKGQEGANKVVVEYTEGDNHIADIYIRARVQNTGRQIAKGCRVLMTSLKEVHPSGKTTETSLSDSLALAWAGWNFVALDVPVGVQFYVNIVKISKHDSGWNFSVEKLFGSNRGLRDYKGTYRFGLTITADNAQPASCQIDITYDGDWHNLRALVT